MGRSRTNPAEPSADPGPSTAPGFVVTVVEVSVSRDLDQRDLPTLRRRLDHALALRPRRLVVDLTGCSRLDAAAIGLLLDVHRRLWGLDGLLSLRAPGPRLRKILEVARVDKVLDIVADDVDEAAGAHELVAGHGPVADRAPVGGAA